MPGDPLDDLEGYPGCECYDNPGHPETMEIVD